MQEPAEHGIAAGVMDMVDLAPLELVVATLPTDQVPGNQDAEDEQAGRTAPVHGRVAEEEVLDDVVVPATHAQADVQEGPLPEVGSEIVLLVGVGHESVVGRHHGHVEVDEVAEERGFVGARVTGGY